MNKIALFTMAVGNDPIYFDSVRRYFPYNKEHFGQNQKVDYFLLTDRTEPIAGVITIPCLPSLWPYTTLLKNNSISDYLDKTKLWEEYTHIFFIDADFAIGDYYDFFTPDFVLVKPYWSKKSMGGFYGGKTNLFHKLCSLFYDEIQFIYENKLSPPRNLDEFYLDEFRKQHQNKIHFIEMDKQTNTLIFYDNENLEEKIKKQGKRLFLHPYKATGRANKTMVTDANGKSQECIVNLPEQYIFNNYTYDFGRLLRIDDTHYRILWSKQPEVREVLNLDTYTIAVQNTNTAKIQSSELAVSIVMPVYNVPVNFMQESVESILRQTFTNFELLIIDDGSTELAGIEKLKSYDDPRIRLITNTHDFIGTLNQGVKEAKGKYIVRMDADDVMLPNRLQVQYDFMENHSEIDVCGSWVELFGNRKETIQVQTEHKQIVTSMLLSNPMAHPTIILRKSSVCKQGEELYKQDYPCAEDYKLWTDLASRGLCFANIPKVLLLYRSSEKQVTCIRQTEMRQAELKIQMEYAEWNMEQLLSKEPKLELYFNSLIDLVNDKVLSFNLLLKTIYNLLQ